MLVCSPAKTIRPAGRASHARHSGSNAGIEIGVAAARPRVVVPRPPTCDASSRDGRPSQSMLADDAALPFGVRGCPAAPSTPARPRGSSGCPAARAAARCRPTRRRSADRCRTRSAVPPSSRSADRTAAAAASRTRSGGARSRRAAARAAADRRTRRARCDAGSAQTKKSAVSSVCGLPSASIVTVTRSSCRADAPDDGLRAAGAAQALGDRRRQPIVAAGDAEDAAVPGGPAFGELLDERQQRQVLRIGEEEPAETADARAQRRRRLHAVEPLRHRLAAQLRRDRRCPIVPRPA